MSEQTLWGAAPEAWESLIVSGLSDYLLPVVSDPNATISPQSKMAALGKTPSHYNRSGHVVGLSQWTQHVTTASDIARWSANPSIGVCVRTGDVLALDVDDSDPTRARTIYAVIESMFGALGITDFPVRYRKNSPKFLVPFRIEGDETYYKRILKTATGAIELLATGQQFVAVGTHTSGVRYDWRNADLDGGPIYIPSIPDWAFDALFAQLTEAFAIGDVTVQNVSNVTPGARNPDTNPVSDQLADYLTDNGHVISHNHDGRLNITCPFSGEHTSESAESATQYFPAGLGGIDKGHFKCLHAHCAHRTDVDFELAVGYVASYFDDDTASPEAQPTPSTGVRPTQAQHPNSVIGTRNLHTMPILGLDSKGRPLQTVENLMSAVMSPKMIGLVIAYDAFKDAIMCATLDAPTDWRQFTDVDYMTLRVTLERNGLRIGREAIRDAVYAVAYAPENQIDTATIWLRSLEWDGIPRVEKFFVTYFNVEDTPYTRACGRYHWSGAAGRIITPGCQCDMSVVFKGGQGVGKTSGIKEMVPGREFYATISLSDRDANASRAMRGRLIGEIEEMRSMGTADAEHIKAFMTRTEEYWIPKFREFGTTFPRRLMFIGTTNQDEILVDDTGNRRWLPLHVRGEVWVDGIKRDRDQLWAEAAYMYDKGGVDWKDAMLLAKDVHEQYQRSDSWADKILHWLSQTDDLTASQGQRHEVRMLDVLTEALHFEVKQIKRADEMRVGSILRHMGYFRKLQRQGDKVSRVWTRDEGQDDAE